MRNTHIHIAILETSQIICEGIQSVLFGSGKSIKMYRLTCLEELNELRENKPVDIFIVNTLLVANREKDVKKIRKSHPNLLLVGLEFGLMQTLPQLWDATFSLYDTSEHFIQLLSLLNEKNKSKTNNTSDDDSLTEREMDVLMGLVHGLSNKEIADTLHISVHTVISHRKNITYKTGIRSQSGLTIYAISKKIISIEDIDLTNH